MNDDWGIIGRCTRHWEMHTTAILNGCGVFLPLIVILAITIVISVITIIIRVKQIVAVIVISGDDGDIVIIMFC